MQDNIRKSRMNFFILGFNAVVIQLVILRELFSIFAGNELLTGLVLACWFVFTGLGALLVKFVGSKINSFYSYLLLTLPLVFTALLLLAFSFYKNQLFQPGVMPGPLEIFYVVTGILLPVCLLSGAAFTVFVSGQSGDKNEIAKYYAVESLGSIISGALFSFVLIRFFDGYQILSIIAILNDFYFIALLTISKRSKSLWFQLFLLLVMVGVLTSTNTKNAALAKLFSGQKIIEVSENEYGKLIVTENSGQFTMYDNGALINTGNNDMVDEESVHYAMIQKPQAHYVLQVSGNIEQTEKEIRKYKVTQIDFVDINKDVSKLEKKYFSSGSPASVNYHFADSRIFIRKTKVTYDVVLLNTPEPLYAQTNRFYTLEFFQAMKKCMNDEAVLGFGLPGVENYMNVSSAALNSSINNTLKSVFKNVILVPGNKLFFIASDGPLTMNIASSLTRNKIENLYVNEYFLDDTLLAQKSKNIQSKLDSNAPLNHDFRPITYYYGLKFWLSQYHVNLYYPLIVFCVVFLLLLIFLKPVNISLLTGGFTASSVEMIVIVAFQAVYGYVYSQVGIIFTLFMAGLFAGSFFFSGKLKPDFRSFITIQITLLIFLFLMWLLFANVVRFPDLMYYVFYLIIFLQAAITGTQFGISTKLKTQPDAINAGNSYGIELFGSAAGALLITTLAIPLLGITNTIIALLLINVLGLLVIFFNKIIFKRFN